MNKEKLKNGFNEALYVLKKAMFNFLFSREIKDLDIKKSQVSSDLKSIKETNERIMGYFPMIDAIASCQTQKSLNTVRKNYEKILSNYNKEYIGYKYGYKRESQITKHVKESTVKNTDNL